MLSGVIFGGRIRLIYLLFLFFGLTQQIQAIPEFMDSDCSTKEYISEESGLGDERSMTAMNAMSVEDGTGEGFQHNRMVKADESREVCNSLEGVLPSESEAYRQIENLPIDYPSLDYMGIGFDANLAGEKLFQLSERFSVFFRELPGEFLSFVEDFSGVSLTFYLILFALFFLANIAFVIVVTVISNWIFNKKERYYENKRKEIIDIVSPYFYDELEKDEEEEILKQLSQYTSRKDRQIILNVLLEGKRNFVGESSSKIKDLYRVLDLHKLSLRKVRFGNWYKRSMGLRELAFLGTVDFKDKIKKYINDRHQHVRAEAILSYMLLDDKNPFGFLLELKYAFVRWDSFSIYYTMYFNGIEPPSMVDMLDHPDREVRLFILRMISIYNQLDAVKKVAKCLLDDDPEIRQEAIITLRSLEYFRVKEMMKKRYDEECYPVRLEILRSMKHFIEDQDISFLEERVRKVFSEVFEAVTLLYRFSDYGEQRLWVLNKELEGKIEEFIKHVAEPRNKSIA